MTRPATYMPERIGLGMGDAPNDRAFDEATEARLIAADLARVAALNDGSLARAEQDKAEWLEMQRNVAMERGV